MLKFSFFMGNKTRRQHKWLEINFLTSHHKTTTSVFEANNIHLKSPNQEWKKKYNGHNKVIGETGGGGEFGQKHNETWT